jgi:ankyrin repeat protein
VNRAIAQGADVNALGPDRRPLLFQASIDGNFELVALLVDNGAGVNSADKDGETPLHFAAREYHLKIAELLLQRGAFVDSEDIHGNTPLHRAVYASQGRGEMIQLLRKYSADKSKKNKHGVSPESLAQSIANFDATRYLR